MKCEQAEMLMAELLAGEIRPEERAALERHLVDCAACRADFATARSGFHVDWPEATPSREVVEAARATFREPPALLRFFRFGTAAAAAVAVALLILGSGGRTEKAPVAVRPAAPPRYLAMVQDAVVGTLVAKDAQGRPAGELGLKSHVVSVEILDGIAKTTVEENFQNHTGSRLEGTFRFPLPPDASISRLALEVNGKIEEGTCLEREKAREVFEGIVRRMKDPALLEWMPGGMFQCRIFPIEPHATKRVIVAYTQALPYSRGTMTYVYPLASEKTKAHPPEELRIDVQARLSGEIRRIESPSHRLDLQRARPNEARASFAARNLRPENDFVLTLESADEELRVVPHKADGDDGTFALFLTPRGAPERRPGRYAFVLDASASVTGPELEVARRVVRAMMERRIDGDRFEVLAHHVDVERSGEVDLRKANDFMDRLSPVGGCDLLKALQAAPAECEIVYIGGGTPTYGELDGSKILDAMKGRRIRTIGVGSHANVSLLERLGGFFRISPNDSVDKRCAEIAATLGSPALSEIKVDGGEAVYDVVGIRDIFYGERLVVTGRYRGPAATLVVTGRDYRRELAVTFPAKEEGANYVRRLWAQRKISDLLAQGEAKKAEVTELGVKHQIMTPYTSFLVLESEQMWKDHLLQREVQKQDEVLGKENKGDPTQIRLGAPSKVAAGTDFFSPALKVNQVVTGPDPGKLDKTLENLEKSSESIRDITQKLKAGKGTVGKLVEDGERVGSDADLGAQIRGLLDKGTQLYKEGKYQDAAAKFEEAFQHKPSSDMVYAYIKRTGDEVIAGMMNHPDRKTQDFGRRLYELAKPGEQFRDGKAVVETYLKQMESNDPVSRRMAAWHLENMKGSLEKSKEPLGAEVEKKLKEYNAALERDNATMRPKAEAYDQLRKDPVPGTGGIKGEGAITPDKPKTREEAVREAYEDQMKRDRQMTTINRRPTEDEYVGYILQLTEMIHEQRGRLTKALNEKALSVAEMQYARQLAERLSQDLAELETKHVEVAREKKHIEEKINHLNQLGVSNHREAKSFKQTQGSLEELLREANAREFHYRTRMDELPFELQLAQKGLSVGNDGGLYLSFKQQDTDDPAGFGGVPHAHFQYDFDAFQHLIDPREIGGGPPDIFTITTNVTVPGALITDALPVTLGVNGLDHFDDASARLGHLSQVGMRTDIAPRKPLESKVTATANEIGLVVIGMGRDDGVLEGDELTMYRGGEFVAKIQIDRADRRWSAAKTILKKLEPRIGDDVSNHIYVSAPGRAFPRPVTGTEEFEVQLDGEGWVLLKSADWTALGIGKVFAITRDRKFVALVQIMEGDGKRARAAVLKRLSVGSPQAGDKARLVIDAMQYLAGLPEEIRKDLASRRSQEEMRVKFGF